MAESEVNPLFRFFIAVLMLHIETDRRREFRQHLLYVQLINVDLISLRERRRLPFVAEVSRHDQFQRELCLLLCPARENIQLQVNACFWYF